MDLVRDQMQEHPVKTVAFHAIATQQLDFAVWHGEGWIFTQPDQYLVNRPLCENAVGKLRAWHRSAKGRWAHAFPFKR